MAEEIQAILDLMVPALRDLMDREIFSESEIRGIVSRRRESEYLIRRQAARKTDFLTYIQAEENLERLRVLRRNKVLDQISAKLREEKAKHRKKDGYNGTYVELKKKQSKLRKFGMGDAHITQHIHLLYSRAKRKWKSDLSWVLSHAEFAKRKKSFKMLGKIYTEAIQIHPRNASLWIEAASFEYFGYKETKKDGTEVTSQGGSIKDARILLQRGLRINNDSQDLWLQSFNLELHYIQKLRGREELMKLQSDSNEPEAVTSIDKDAKIARIIYNNAIKAIPDKIGFRLKFVDVSRQFPQTQDLIEYIMGSIEDDFEQSEEAWIVRARHYLETMQESEQSKTSIIQSFANHASDQNDEENSRKRKREESEDRIMSHHSKILQILDEATDKLHSTKMFIDVLKFLQWYCAEYVEDEEERRMTQGVSKISQFVSKLLQKMDHSLIDTIQFIAECADVLVEMQMSSEALRLLKVAIKVSNDSNHQVLCWIKLSELTSMKCSTASLQESVSILRNALKVLPMHCKGYDVIQKRLFMQLVSMAMEKLPHSLKATDDCRREISSLFEKILLLHQSRQSITNEDMTDDTSVATVALAYLFLLKTADDLIAIRDLFRKVSTFYSNLIQAQDMTQEEIKPLSLFFSSCISIETTHQNQVSIRRDNQLLLKEMYGKAVKFFTSVGATSLADDFIKRKGETLPLC